MKSYLVLALCLLGLSLSPMYAGESALIVCEHGQERLDWDIAFIREAHHAIDISAVYFHGEIARRFLTEIEARLIAEPKLQVHLLINPICAEPEDLDTLHRLNQAYPLQFHYEATAPVAGFSPDVHGVENHTKICLVDGYYFSIGGTNITDYEYVDGSKTPARRNPKNELVRRFAAGFRDGNVVGRGAVAQEMRRQFCRLYALWRHYNCTLCLEKNLDYFQDEEEEQAITDTPWVASFETCARRIVLPDSQITFLVGGPHQHHNAITEAYIQQIRAARKEICISHMFCFPVDKLFDALLDAVNRGVKVTLVTNGNGEDAPSQNSMYVWANRISYVPLFYGKRYQVWDYFTMKKKDPKQTVNIREYGIPNVQLHKKVVILDDHVVLIGSYNLGSKSDQADYEMNLMIDSEAVAAAAKHIFARDCFLSRPITPAQAVKWYFDPSTAYMGRVQRLLGGLCF